MVDLQPHLTWERSLCLNTTFASFERGERSSHKRRGESSKDGSRKVAVSHSISGDATKRSAGMIEKQRRMQMANSILYLKSLLPSNIVKPHMDKCRILGEAEMYIVELQKEIMFLEEKKKTLMHPSPPQLGLTHHYPNNIHQPHQQELEKEREEKEKEKDKDKDKEKKEKEIENEEKGDEIWVELIPRCREIFITISSSHMHSKRGSLGLSSILGVLEKANIEVINANVSSNHQQIGTSSSCLMLHGKMAEIEGEVDMEVDGANEELEEGEPDTRRS